MKLNGMNRSIKLRLSAGSIMLAGVFALLANAIEIFSGRHYAAIWGDCTQLIGYGLMAAAFALDVKTNALSASTTRTFRICAWIFAINAGLHGYLLVAHWWRG